MRVLIDTNVFIERESDRAVPEELQQLEHLLNKQGHDILVHLESKQEIRNYGHPDRRARAESKIATYEDLRLPRYPTQHDETFRSEIDKAEDFNEQVDNALLYAVHSDQADVLITEDRGIHRKAARIDLDDRVLTIEEGCGQFQDEEPPDVTGLPSVRKVTLSELDVEDPIFDSLKAAYDFTDWFRDHPDRYAYVNWNRDDTLGAVLILKPGEIEAIGDSPPLGRKERLKVNTLKVAEDRRGSKIGELLINIAVREAINHEIDEMYLTHYIEEDDYLVQLIADYGFERASELDNGESLFLKRLTPGIGDDPTPRETHYRFYPSYYDGPSVDKYIIPVRPEYHDRLFPFSEHRRPQLQDFAGEFHSEGNSIKKAYLSHANIRSIEPDDVLVFYRSIDQKSVTSIGVCERVDYAISRPEQVQNLIGRRSVFSEHEVRQYTDDGPTTVILFKWHFDLPSPVKWRHLRDQGKLDGAIRTTQGLDEAVYKYIRQRGDIDERFTIN